MSRMSWVSFEFGVLIKVMIRVRVMVRVRVRVEKGKDKIGRGLHFTWVKFFVQDTIQDF